MRGTGPPTGFAWLEPHDAAQRDSAVLFGVAVAVLALYCLGVFALVVLVAEASKAGTADRLVSFDAETVLAVGGLGAACVIAAALFTLAAWRDTRSRRARDVGTRGPTTAEAVQVRGHSPNQPSPTALSFPDLHSATTQLRTVRHG